MAFYVRDPILSIVEDRAAFIETLIQEYPRLINDWENSMDDKFQEEAEIISEGDPDIMLSVLSQMREAFSDRENRLDLFNKAMLMLTFSYFDSLATILSKGANPSEKIKALCRSKNIELSNVAEEANKFLKSKVIKIRNCITHDFSNRPNKQKEIKDICLELDGIDFVDEEIKIYDSNFVIDVLNKEKLVLSEVCKKIGYKHKKIN